MSEPFYTLESLEPNNSVGFLIKRCGIVMTQIAERRFESQAISFTQCLTLIWLTQRAHASPTELSLHLGYDLGSLTRLVDDLERVGRVRRDRSRDDRRVVRIAITPLGRRVAQAGKRLMVELLNELAAPYDRAEVDTLISLLQRLLSRLQDLAPPSRPAGSQGSDALAAIRTPRSRTR
jgi:DNA-binding MarR family transcriptional regulator